MKRIAVLLAAILIAAAGALSVSAEPDESGETVSASESAVVASEVTEPSADSTEDSTPESTEESAEDSTEESAEDSTQENTGESAEDSTQQSTQNSKQESKQDSQQASEASADETTTTYQIAEADMSLAVPSEMYVITRDTNKDDPVLALNRTTKDEVMKSFRENDIYFRAVTRDFSCVVNVTINETEDTQAIGQLMSLDEDNQQSIIDKLLDSDIYTDCTKTTYHGVLFFTFRINYDSGDTKIQGIQQYTIVNGKNVRITYQTTANVKDDPNRKMFDQVMDSVQFEKIETASEPESSVPLFDMHAIDIRYVYIGIAGFLGLLSLIIIVSAARSYRKANRRPKPDQKDTGASGKSDETPSSEPQEEEKDIFSDTAKKKSSGTSSDEVTLPKAKPMTYEDVISARPQVSQPVEVTQPLDLPPAAKSRRNTRNKPAAPTATDKGEEIVFAVSREKRRTEIEQISPSGDKNGSAEPLMVVTPPEESLSSYEKRFGKSKPLQASPLPVTEKTATDNKPTAKDSKPATDSKPAAKDSKPVTDSKPAADTPSPKASTDDQPSQDTAAKDTAPSAEGIQLEISTAADGALLIGATKGASGQPMDIEIRDQTRLSEEEDKRLEAMGFETARHNEIYNAVSAEKDRKPFVVKAKPRPNRVPKSKTLSPPKIGTKAADAAATHTKADTTTATTEESEVTTMHDLFANDTPTPEQQLSEFERNSGIQVERAPAPKRLVVPMQTPFTDIPRLESVNAEEYNRQYEEMKKTMPKNHAYAQRFRTTESSRSDKKPAPATPSEEPSAAPAEAPSPWEEPSPAPQTAAQPPKNSQDNSGLFEYYTGYDEPAAQPDTTPPPTSGKKKGSVGSRFKRTLGKFFAPDPPFDEEDDA